MAKFQSFGIVERIVLEQFQRAPQQRVQLGHVVSVGL